MRLLTLSRSFIPILTGIALCAGVLAQTPAAHADDWCFFDPTISVNGQQIQIVDSLQGSIGKVAELVKVVQFTVYVPRHASTQVVSLDKGPFVEVVTFVEGSRDNTVKIVTSFPDETARTAQLPAEMQVMTKGATYVVTGSTSGTLSQTITLSSHSHDSSDQQGDSHETGSHGNNAGGQQGDSHTTGSHDGSHGE